jgi:thiol-disulfide isomerase/thioredoxin
MHWKLILSIAVMLLATSAGIAAEPAASARTIILFGADWCAPCVAELRDLPALADAAAPDRLILAWTDRPARVPDKAVRSGVTQVTVARARELMARYGEGNAGLPLVVMLRSDGTPCAIQHRSLSSEGLAALLKRCDDRR